MSQKKKTQMTTANQLKHIKSAENLPLAPLMQEIGQLKAELTLIKHNKKRDLVNPNKTSAISKQNDKKTINLTCPQLSTLSKEYKYKVQLQLHNVRKDLKSLQPTASQQRIQSFNKLIKIFCQQINELVTERDNLKAKISQYTIQKQEENKQSDKKFAILARNNKRLQIEVQELRREIATRPRGSSQMQQEMMWQCQRQKEVIEQLKIELKELTKTNLQLQSLIEQWELQCRKLQQTRLDNEAVINAKDEQLRSSQEDIQYLRIETQKFKTQKKQFQKLWQKASLDLREFKKIHEEDIAKIEREKNRWMNQCAFRRHDSQQIQAIGAEKELLFKQIQQTRNNYTLKCRELAEKSTLLHDLQRKIISLESQNFKLSNQSERLRRQTGYWSNEMAQLREQVSKLNNLKGQMKGEDTEKRSREKKVKALNDIFSLIQMQRQDNGDQLTF